MNPLWTRAMRRKAHLLTFACINEIGRVFTYCDSDVWLTSRAAGEMESQLGKCDLAMSSAGVLVCRASPKTVAFFKTMVADVENWPNEQSCFINHLLKSKVSFKELPDDKFFCYREVDGGSNWDGREFPVPVEMVAFHANYCANDKKVSLVNFVRSRTQNN